MHAATAPRRELARGTIATSRLPMTIIMMNHDGCLVQPVARAGRATAPRWRAGGDHGEAAVSATPPHPHGRGR